jgi:hypothetical protein
MFRQQKTPGRTAGMISSIPAHREVRAPKLNLLYRADFRHEMVQEILDAVLQGRC